MANRQKTLDPSIFTIDDLARLGTARLSRTYADYYNEGAMDLISLHDNVAAYNRFKIRPRVLRDVSNSETVTEIFGKQVSFPLGLSPTAMHKLAHPDGEIATSKAAAKANIPMILSSYSTTSMEDVVAHENGNPYCFQVTFFKDRDLTRQLIHRAAGYNAIVVSVDLPVLGRRLNEMRNDFSLPEDTSLPNFPFNNETIIHGTNSGVEYDPTLEWSTVIPWLRKETSLQIWLKGVLTAEDIALAISYQVDGVLISNHGGRQLDGVPATLDVLEECGEMARGKIKLAVDGGIRRGSDIFKALALGADFCFIGRAAIWGLAYNGQAGVDLAIEMLRQEFVTTMLLAGCKSLKDITRSHLSIRGGDGRLHKL